LSNAGLSASAKAGGRRREQARREWKEWPKGLASLLQLRAAVTELAEASALHRCVGRRRFLYNSFISILPSPVIICCPFKK